MIYLQLINQLILRGPQLVVGHDELWASQAQPLICRQLKATPVQHHHLGVSQRFGSPPKNGELIVVPMIANRMIWGPILRDTNYLAICDQLSQLWITPHMLPLGQRKEELQIHDPTADVQSAEGVDYNFVRSMAACHIWKPSISAVKFEKQIRKLSSCKVSKLIQSHPAWGEKEALKNLALHAERLMWTQVETTGHLKNVRSGLK